LIAFVFIASEQDAQEFLRYLLEGLHEDVNEVQEKPTPVIVDERREEHMK
jgi:ubiquitin C-terminal hydrolase